MKKIFFILLFTILGVSFGQLVDPGHPAVHPQMNDYCRTCHACDNPSTNNPCLIECPRHGAEFKGIHNIEEGPEVVIIDKLSNLYHPVVFAHELHASMSAMSGGCTLCHHYSEESGEIPACDKCHINRADIKTLDEPSLKGAYHRQCLGCHREWSHDNACEFCHKEAGSPSEVQLSSDPTDIVGTLHPLIEAQTSYIYDTNYEEGKIVTFHHTDHVDLFGLNCTDCHKGDNCYRCHNVDKPERSSSNIKHIDTCGKCHQESNCSFCHSEKAKPQFNHSVSTNFELGKYHDNLSCNRCHSSVKNFVIPTTECTFCHNDDWDVGIFDHSVTGLTLNDIHAEIDCDMCHIDRDFNVEPSCYNCHDEDVVYPDYSPGD